MGKTVETGSVDQQPADLRESGTCPECGEVVDEDGDHDCEE